MELALVPTTYSTSLGLAERKLHDNKELRDVLHALASPDKYIEGPELQRLACELLLILRYTGWLTAPYVRRLRELLPEL